MLCAFVITRSKSMEAPKLASSMMARFSSAREMKEPGKLTLVLEAREPNL